MGEPISQLLFDMILQEISQGRPLTVICREMGVDRRDIYKFRDRDDQRKVAYREARSDGFDALAEECQEIADDSSGDTKMGKFGPVMDGEYVARSKLRIETRLKLLACFDPSRYGAKLDVTTNGGDMKPQSLVDFYRAMDPLEPAAPTAH